MERLFAVECPQCRGAFSCHYNEMRHSGVKLFCPFCHHRFLPEEAASLDDREEQPVLAAGPHSH